jgi:predicted DNA-binding protein (MmcQ/YjbR family)/8-oxo-dGTP pyrophosphatase MutT (NUDIX family)
MTWESVLGYCLAKPGAWQDEPWEGDVVAKVGGKIFAFLGSGDTPSVGLKCGASREAADEWLLRYPDDASVMAYIGRSGWNTLRIGGAIPDDELLEAVDASYSAIVGKLPRKDRPGPGRLRDVTQESMPLPAIPVSAGALIFDRSGRLLILKPTYKSGWTIPGGVMEADGESPWEACQREVREETGLEVSRGRLAAMDFRRPRPGRAGGIRFLFDCGRLSDGTLADVKLQPEEISEFRLVPLPEALTMLRKPIRRRVRAATSGRRPAYLENGRPASG